MLQQPQGGVKPKLKIQKLFISTRGCNLYYSIKINLRSQKIAKSRKSRCEGCRPPRVANEGSMDRPFYGVGQGDKKIRKSGSTGREIPF